MRKVQQGTCFMEKTNLSKEISTCGRLHTTLKGINEKINVQIQTVTKRTRKIQAAVLGGVIGLIPLIGTVAFASIDPTELLSIAFKVLGGAGSVYGGFQAIVSGFAWNMAASEDNIGDIPKARKKLIFSIVLLIVGIALAAGSSSLAGKFSDLISISF